MLRWTGDRFLHIRSGALVQDSGSPGAFNWREQRGGRVWISGVEKSFSNGTLRVLISVEETPGRRRQDVVRLTSGGATSVGATGRTGSGDDDAALGCLSSEREHFLECYERNGGAATVGLVLDPESGGNPCTRWWGRRAPVVVQHFDGGSEGRGAIVDNEGQPHSRAFWIHGEIWKEYVSLGGPDSPLGRPTSDEIEAGRSPQGTQGRVSRFEEGSIYWSAPYGAHAVLTGGAGGGVGRAFEARGGTTGPLGFPTGDRRPQGNLLVQDFEGGTLRQNARGETDLQPRSPR